MPDEQITDEALEDAVGELEGEAGETETPEETPETDELKTKPEEKDEINIEDLMDKLKNDIKSDLGRNKSYVDRKIEEVSTMIESLAGIIKQQNQPEYNGENYIPQTKEELDAYLEERDRKRQEQRQQYDAKYENEYLDTFNKLSSQHGDKVANALDRVMREKFNVRYSDDPAADAERNYLKAKIHLMEQASIKKKNPLKGADPNTPLGSSLSGESDVKNTRVPELDEFASDFVKRMGIGDDEVKKALSGGLDAANLDAFRRAGKA